MAVSGVVLRQNLPRFQIVDSYYRNAPHEPTRKGLLPVDRVQSFGATFKGLVDAILANKRSHVVVVAHGMPEIGLIMPIMPGTKVSAGVAIETLLPVVDSMDGGDGKTADDEALRAAANDWGVSKADVLRMAQVCWKIRWSDGIAVAIHIRGCDIGADRRHLRRIQRLFRSSVVSAPDCPMFFVSVAPGRPVADVEAFKRSHGVVGRRFTYTKQAGASAGPLMLDIEYAGDRSASQAAVQAQADIHRWAIWMHQNPSTASYNSFPVSGLYPHDSEYYFLAVEPEYVDRLVAVADTT